MNEYLPQLIRLASLGHFAILIASALVPLRLDWQRVFVALPKLHRQMYWVYGGYVVLSIIAFGVVGLLNADELARGSGLARSFCAYVSLFWIVRLCLQGVLDAKEHLTAWWLTAGYHGLTVMFLFFAVTFGWAAFAIR